MEAHIAQIGQGKEGQRQSAERPSISVCMAVYNGANFIKEQIASILPQLDDKDEFVIVDDASLDNTIAVIDSFRDGRIRVVRQERNCGVVKTFVRALEEARGGIIFLSDQDDVWLPDKVRTFMDMFSASSDLTLILSDYQIIDGNGDIAEKTRFKREKSKFHLGVLHNLWRNGYRGCTMAFRRSVLEYCLPIPADIWIHDMWIGLINELYGRAEFIDEPLISYRRHDKNDSAWGPKSLAQVLRARWPFARHLAWLYMREVVLRGRWWSVARKTKEKLQINH